jgi:hypothetical protein
VAQLPEGGHHRHHGWEKPVWRQKYAQHRAWQGSEMLSVKIQEDMQEEDGVCLCYNVTPSKLPSAMLQQLQSFPLINSVCLLD